MSKIGTKQTTKNPSGVKGSAKDTRPGSIKHSGHYQQKKVQPQGR